MTSQMGFLHWDYMVFTYCYFTVVSYVCPHQTTADFLEPVLNLRLLASVWYIFISIYNIYRTILSCLLYPQYVKTYLTYTPTWPLYMINWMWYLTCPCIFFLRTSKYFSLQDIYKINDRCLHNTNYKNYTCNYSLFTNSVKVEKIFIFGKFGDKWFNDYCK